MFLQKDNLNEAVEAVSKGFIIGIPTETVYGIGVDPVSYTHLTLPTNREV